MVQVINFGMENAKIGKKKVQVANFVMENQKIGEKGTGGEFWDGKCENW